MKFLKFDSNRINCYPRVRLQTLKNVIFKIKVIKLVIVQIFALEMNNNSLFDLLSSFSFK